MTSIRSEGSLQSQDIAIDFGEDDPNAFSKLIEIVRQIAGELSVLSQKIEEIRRIVLE